MLTKRLLTAGFVFALVTGMAGISPAQEASSVKTAAQDTGEARAGSAPAETQPPYRAYKLDFSIDELENGKKLNSRQYSVDVDNMGRPGMARAGTRVPAGVKSDGTPQYLDVNTSISASLYTRGGKDGVFVNCDVASVAPGDDTGAGRPVLRTLDISGGTILVEGKPIILGVADDPNSKRQFQLEMTVTQLK